MNEEVLNVISILLVLGAFGIVVVGYIGHKMDKADEILSFTPMDTDPIPDHFQPREEHIKRVLADLQSLRTPLKDYKLPRAGADPYVAHVNDVRLP